MGQPLNLQVITKENAERIDFGTYRIEIYLTNGTSMESDNIGFVINGKLSLLCKHKM